jgi:hypothetical protein
VEIFGVIRNTSTVKTKLNGGVLKEDLKIELPRQFRKLKSITQVDGDLGFRKSGTPKKNPVVRDGGFSLREREFNMWILFLYLGISKQSGMAVLVVCVEGLACKPHGQKGISMPANEMELEAVKTSRGINLGYRTVALGENINDEMANKWAVKNSKFSVKQPLMR